MEQVAKWNAGVVRRREHLLVEECSQQAEYALPLVIPLRAYEAPKEVECVWER